MILNVGQVKTVVEGTAKELKLLATSMTMEGEDEEGKVIPLPLMEGNVFYSGMVKRVGARLTQLNIKYSINYTYKAPTPVSITFEFPKDILRGITLYPYQCLACRKFLMHSGRGLIEAGTGAGKTEIAIALTKFLNVKTIFFCDRIFTMEQTYERFRAYGIHAGRFGGGHSELDCSVLVAVVDSLYSRLNAVRDRSVAEFVRTARFLIVDECFPAGTLIDGRPIETYKEGDTVTAFDEKTKKLLKSHVTHVFKKQATQLVRVYAGGKSVVCTPNHPFFTNRGWVNASDLNHCDTLYRVREASRTSFEVEERSVQTNGTHILQQRMREGSFSAFQFSKNGIYKSPLRFSSYEKEKPHVLEGFPCEDVRDTQINWSWACSAGRKWERAYSSRIAACESVGLEDSNDCQNRETATAWNTNLLQARYWQRIAYAWDRNRRSVAWLFSPSSAGSQEDFNLEETRVDCVEILKRRSDGRFGEVCSDGFVYNLEVADQQTYVANGFVVHNCHHGPSKTWSTVLEHSDADYRLGMSASSFGTPTEVAFDDLRLVGLTGDIICKIPPRWLIDHGTCRSCSYTGRVHAQRCGHCGKLARGYLAEPFVYVHTVKALPVASWNYNTVYQRAIVEPKVRNEAICSFATQFEAMGLKTLVLINRIQHGFKLIEMLDREDVIFSYGGGRVYFKPDSRLRSRKKFHEDVWSPSRVRDYFNQRKSGILIGSSVFDEGVDLPSMQGLILGGGGKSWRRTIQQIGRPMHSKADFIFVADFRDVCHRYVLKHSELRMQTYRRLQYRYFTDPKEFSKHLPKPLTISSRNPKPIAVN
jgi:hypothetical protein